MSLVNTRILEDPNAMYVPLSHGLFTSPSRLQAPVGSLSNCRNFEVVNGAYEETQGLTIVGPSLSEGLDDFWHAEVPSSTCVVSGTMVQGDILYWYASDGVTVAGTGRLYYVDAGVDNVVITLDKVAGISPRRATNFYSSSGATIVYSGLTDFFIHQTQLDISWDDYLGEKFLGALSASQREMSSAWDAFKPDPLGVQGISGVFQFRDSNYAVRDFWGGRFEDGVEEPSINDLLSVDDAGAVGAFTSRVAGYELYSGSWEQGTAEGVIWFYPSVDTALDMSLTDNWTNSATISNITTGNTLGNTLATGERQYSNKGLLWKQDVEQRSGGWKYIDTGYSLSFDSGKVAPVAAIRPLFVTDQLASIRDTGDSNLTSPATQYPVTGTYSTWTGLDNVDDTTPGAYASTTIAANDFSRVMELEFPSNLLDGDVKVLGVEVKITAHDTAAGDNVVINKAQLRNVTSGKTYLSANRADRPNLSTSTSEEHVFGTQLDTWELGSIDQEDIATGNYSLLLQFENETASSKTVNVDMVQIVVHYSVKGQKVYFNDGTLDVATATLYAYQVFDGEWNTDDAEGWMTLHDVVSSANIVPGLDIRSEAGGTGDIIATTRTLSRNLLPSMEEMENAGTIYQEVVTTFSADADDSSVYVATGASPAFSLDKDDIFSFIRLPVDRDKDTPRYVLPHRNHLMLSVGSHFLVSSIAAPNNFNTYDGATTWNPKDTITGMAAAADGTSLITCEDSIHAFIGSGASGGDQFALKIITDNSGARPYTLTNLLGNIFVDYSGISTAAISDKYGGFDVGKQSQHVRSLLRRMLGHNAQDVVVGNRVIGAIPVRKKNQYRIYFSDGEILTATIPDQQGIPLQFTRQNYTAYRQEDARGYEATFAPTALSSAVLSNGDESILIGTKLGHVMRVDPKYMDILSYVDKRAGYPERRDSMATWKFFKFLDINPIHAPDASTLVEYKGAEVYLEHAGWSTLNHIALSDYQKFNEVPNLGTVGTTIGTSTSVGDTSDYPGTEVDDYFTWYLNMGTDGLSMRFSQFGGIGSIPLRLSAVNLHADPKGNTSGGKRLSRRYEVSEGTIPQDIIITGTTGTAHANGHLGTVAYNVDITGITGTANAEGNTGEVNFGVAIWTFDDTFTLDSDTHTFDGAPS